MHPTPKLPEAFTERLKCQFSKQADELIAAIGQRESVSLRINPEKFASDKGSPVPWCQTGIYLSSRPSFVLDPLWHAGCYYVQESSSMFLEQVFRQLPCEKPRIILDLCAAPGGKSTHLLHLLSKDDLLIANEVIHSRFHILRENLFKWGKDNLLSISRDPKEFGQLGPLFDTIMIDAPCSGEGLFRKDPSAIKEWSRENAGMCSVRQRRILIDSLPSLKEGGYLIYSTCTFNPEENEKNMDWLQQQGDYRSIRIPLDPGWKVDEIEFNGIWGYRFLPHRVKGEGFFICLLQKESTSATSKGRQKSDKRRERPKTVILPEPWLTSLHRRIFVEHDDNIYSLPAIWEPEIRFLREKLRLPEPGIPVASVRKGKWNPHHSLAMNTDLIPSAFRPLELTLTDALAYLRRQTFPFSGNTPQWRLVCYQGHPLGFIKDLGHRFNNYYPKEWRIRTSREQEAPSWHEC